MFTQQQDDERHYRFVDYMTNYTLGQLRWKCTANEYYRGHSKRKTKYDLAQFMAKVDVGMLEGNGIGEACLVTKAY